MSRQVKFASQIDARVLEKLRRYAREDDPRTIAREVRTMAGSAASPPRVAHPRERPRR